MKSLWFLFVDLIKHIKSQENPLDLLILFHLCIIFNGFVCLTFHILSSFECVFIRLILFFFFLSIFCRVFFPALSLTKTWNSILHTDQHTHYMFPVRFALFFFCCFFLFLSFVCSDCSLKLSFVQWNKHTKKGSTTL